MLQVLFGDDEHTGEIGPYQRLMKNRKWVLLGSAGILACTSGLYDPVAQKATVKVVSLPLATLETGLALGLVYMLVQNLLLLGQLFTCYQITLADRFSERRAEERTAATSRYHEAQKQLALIERADYDNAQAITDRLMASANAAQFAYNKARATQESYQNSGRSDPESYANAQSTKEELSRTQSELQKHLSVGKDVKRRPEVENAINDVKFASDELDRIKSSNATLQPGYRTLEMAIDIMRLGPAPLVGAWALVQYFLLAPHVPFVR